jgi:hypothetical protein
MEMVSDTMPRDAAGGAMTLPPPPSTVTTLHVYSHYYSSRRSLSEKSSSNYLSDELLSADSAENQTFKQQSLRPHAH